MYDYLIVGAGLFGSVFAYEMKQKNKKVLIIDKRDHIGGNCYTKNIEDINVHMYGPHIFHTNNKKIWDYINKFANFNNFINRIKLKYKNKIYSMPINLMTFNQIAKCITPTDAINYINENKINFKNPSNLEEWILSQVGEKFYKILIKGYTKKQWQCNPKKLPCSIIKRLPIRLTYDDNYYNHLYQGIPIGGYTQIFEKMLNGIEIKLQNDDYKNWNKIAKKLVYSGKIDEFFNYKYGELEYRSLKFDHKILDTNDFQGNAIINYGEEKIPYTRIVEHKHFEFKESSKTIVTYEYPIKWDKTKIPYYPVNNKHNDNLYKLYKNDLYKLSNVIIGGRLGNFKYIDMDQTIASSLNAVNKELNIL